MSKKLPRRVVLRSAAAFPAAAVIPASIVVGGSVPETSTTTVTVPKLFYVWWFDRVAEDYVPVAVYNTRTEAEADLKQRRESLVPQPRYVGGTGAVLELSWQDFVEMSVSSRLKELAEPIKRLAATLSPSTEPEHGFG